MMENSTNTMPDALLSVNGAALLLKGRGIKPNTRYSILAAIARDALPVAAHSQWGVLIRREDVERYAHELSKITTEGPSKKTAMHA